MTAPNSSSVQDYTVDQVLEALQRALQEEDMPAVAALLRLLAVKDPRAAEMVLEVIDIASSKTP